MNIAPNEFKPPRDCKKICKLAALKSMACSFERKSCYYLPNKPLLINDAYKT